MPPLSENESCVATSFRTNRFGKKLVKVVLTGGPCAGKSTAIEEFKERIKKDHSKNWQVFSAPEAASILLFGGVWREQLTTSQLAQWQLDVLTTIFRIEDVFENIAINEPYRHTLILCDRGGMDPKVFTTPHMWGWILMRMQMTNDMVLNRYDKVIQLQTAPRDHYSWDSNKFRREDYEEAKAVNKKYTEAWKCHKRFVSVLDNENDSWETKANEVWTEVEELILEQ